MLQRSTVSRLGAGLLVGAGALAVAALVVRDSTPSEHPVAFVEPAVLDSPPSTAATLPPIGGPQPVTSTADVGPAVATLPLSPLADQLPPRVSVSALRPPVPAPVALWIGDIGLWAPVTPVGFQADGQLEIPDETEVGWYRFGSAPGRVGSTVLAAHVTWNDTVGPFFRLPELEPGARIKLLLGDGASRHYEVVERAQYGKSELPAERVWTRDGDETLVLITCGGDFNRQVRRYTDNIVLYAVPVADPGESPTE